MKEKCLQLVADLAVISAPAKERGAVLGDFIFELISSWEYSANEFLMQTCFSALMVLSSATVKSVQRLILNNLNKLEVVLHRHRIPALFSAMLTMCDNVCPSIVKIPSENEESLLGLVIHWLSQSKELKLRVCELLVSIDEAQPSIVHRIFSRREVETPLIVFVTMAAEDDLASAISGLRALNCLASDFNTKPFWLMHPWAYSFKFKHRSLCSIEFLVRLHQIYTNYTEESESLLIFSYCLRIVASIQDSLSFSYDSEFMVAFMSIFMPDFVNLLLVITHKRDLLYGMEPRQLKGNKDLEDATGLMEGLTAAEEEAASSTAATATTTTMTTTALGGIDTSIFKALSALKSIDHLKFLSSSAGKDKDSFDVNGSGSGGADTDDIKSDKLNAMDLVEVNAAYEVMASAAIQAISSLVFGTGTDLSQYFNVKRFFKECPICEVVHYTMLQLPSNFTVQTKGISILSRFVSNGLHLKMVGGCASTVLVGAMVAFSDESVINLCFCKIIKILSESGDNERRRILESNVFKWLYTVLKSSSPDIAPLACNAVTCLADNAERAEILGNAGLCRVLVQLMDKHGNLFRIQRDGLRCALALCQSTVCLRLFKANGGYKTMSNARSFLKGFFDSPDVLLAENYSVEELHDLIEASSMSRMQAGKCIVS